MAKKPQKAPLSTKEKMVFEYVTRYFNKHGVFPTRAQIAEHFEFKSANSAQQYVDQLEEKGYLKNFGTKQGLSIIDSDSKSTIPLVGRVAAGLAREAFEIQDEIQVPADFITKGKFFALKIEGLSMIEDGILEDDIVIVKEQDHANNGEIVVAQINGESTVKRYFQKTNHIELKPANKTMKSILVNPGDTFSIKGIVKGLLRRF